MDEPEQEEEAFSTNVALFQKLTLKLKELTQLLCVMLVQARLMMVLNEILLLMKVSPDEIEEDSDEGYESDFEDD